MPIRHEQWHSDFRRFKPNSHLGQSKIRTRGECLTCLFYWGKGRVFKLKACRRHRKRRELVPLLWALCHFKSGPRVSTAFGPQVSGASDTNDESWRLRLEALSQRRRGAVVAAPRCGPRRGKLTQWLTPLMSRTCKIRSNQATRHY